MQVVNRNLPDSINVDISNLELGQKIYTVDLKHDDYSFLHSENTVICQVKTSRASLMPEIEEAETGSAETDESKRIEIYQKANQLMIDNAITLFITDFVGMQPINKKVSNDTTVNTLTGYGTMGRNLSFRELVIN